MIKESYRLQNHNIEKNSTKVEATFEFHQDTLLLTYHVSGDLSSYHFPKSKVQQRSDGLWQDSCFELFIAPKDSEEYWEFNISPSSEWNLYHFKSYKEEMRESDIISTPIIEVKREKERYSVSFKTTVAQEHFNKVLDINLCVILLDNKGVRHFYSIKRRAESPDFHDRAYFEKEVSSLTL